MNYQTGELEQQTLTVFGEKKQLDSQAYYKMYDDQIQKFFGLSKNSMKLFNYIMKNISYNKHRVCLTSDTLMTDLDIAKGTAFRSITQLLEAGIIARAERDNCYFINPTIAFKGDWLMMIKEYILDKGKSTMVVKEPDSEYYTEPTT